MIYFIQEDQAGPIKIGVAENVKRRLASLQTSSAHELRLLATMQGGTVVEADLHNRFSELRIRGEWFKPAPPLVEFIASLNSAERPERIIDTGGGLAVCRMCGWTFCPENAQDRSEHAQVHARLAQTALPFPLDEQLKHWGYSIIQTGDPGAFFRGKPQPKEVGKRVLAFAKWISLRAHPAATPQAFESFMATTLDEMDELYPDGMETTP